MLRADMIRLSGEQQFSTVSFIALATNEGLTIRLRALEKIAEDVSRDLIGKPFAIVSCNSRTVTRYTENCNMLQFHISPHFFQLTPQTPYLQSLQSVFTLHPAMARLL